MISGTYGQEVGVYYDASEMYAMRVGAGLAEGNWRPGGRHPTRRSNGRTKTANEAISDVATRIVIYISGPFPMHSSQNQHHPQW